MLTKLANHSNVSRQIQEPTRVVRLMLRATPPWQAIQYNMAIEFFFLSFSWVRKKPLHTLGVSRVLLLLLRIMFLKCCSLFFLFFFFPFFFWRKKPYMSTNLANHSNTSCSLTLPCLAHVSHEMGLPMCWMCQLWNNEWLMTS